MSFEDIENKLIALGTDAGDPNYFLNIANLLANLYDKNFSNSKLKKIFHSSNNRENSIKDMRLDLTSLNLPLNSERYLEFPEKFTLKFDDSSYIIINLKGLVEEFIIDGHPTYFRHQLNISEAYELLDTGSYNYDKNSYFEFLYSLYTTSLIYKYAYLTLESQARDKNSYTKAGMFKNAYFDIIELCEHIKNSELEL